MKNLLSLFFLGITFFSYSQICPDVNAIGVVSNGIIENDTITVCLGDTVYLKDGGSYHQNALSLTGFEFEIQSSYYSLGSQLDSLMFVKNASGVSIIRYWVTDINGCQGQPFYLFVVAADVPSNFSNQVVACEGDSLTLAFSPNSYDSTFTLGGNLLYETCLLDYDTTYLEVLKSGVSPATITSPSDIEAIFLGIEYSYMGDLTFYVECPNGQSDTIFTPGGGATQLGVPNQNDNSCAGNYGEQWYYEWNLTASETAQDWVTAQGTWGLTLPSGAYLPENDLTSLVGCPTNGIWKLVIIDNWAADDGSLDNYGINFNPSVFTLNTNALVNISFNAANSYFYTTDPFTYLSSDQDTLLAVNMPVGDYLYNYHLEDLNGCIYEYEFEYTLNTLGTIQALASGSVCDSTSLAFLGTNLVGSDSVEVEIVLFDSFGDGWNGNTADIIVYGDTANVTCPSSSSQSYFYTILEGDTLTINYNATGNYQNENEIILLADGLVIYHDGINFSNPISTYQQILVTSYTINWGPDTLFVNNIASNPVLDADSVGNFQVWVSAVYPNSPSCFVTDTITISVLENPEILDSTFYACYGDSTEVELMIQSGLAPYVSNWHGIDSSSVGIGTYAFSVTDQNGCKDSITFNVVPHDSIYFDNVISSDEICPEDSNGLVQFTVEGGTGSFAIDWQGIDTSNLSAGIYEIYAIDTTGCRDTLIFQIQTLSNIQVLGVVTDVQTQNDGEVDITVSGGVGSMYTYSWSNGDSTEDVTGLSGGDYIVIITDSAGCEIVDTFTIVDPFVGLDENGIEQFIIYPNPTSGILNIQLSKSYSDLVIEVFDLKGVLLDRKVQNGMNLIQLNMSQIAPGTYIVRLKNADIDEVFKVEKY